MGENGRMRTNCSRGSHVERTQKGTSEQILIVAGIGPTLDVAHTGTIIRLLDKESLVYLPSLAPDNCRKGELGVARDGVDGGLATVRWLGR